jgi:hypothetical protein
MLSKMKEGVIASFDTNITLREEEVKRSEMQRQMPGWSFCTFFVLKVQFKIVYTGEFARKLIIIHRKAW